MGWAVGEATADRPPVPLFCRSTVRLVAPLLLLTLLGAAGNLLAPAMLERTPFLLSMLNPRTPFLLAAAPTTPPLLFLSLAMARLVAADPSHYLLGRRHGPAALGWVASRGGHAHRLLQFASRQFRRGGVLMVFLAPKGNVLLVAGAHNASFLAVAVADCAGTLVRLVAIYFLGHALSDVVGAAAPTVSYVVFTIWLTGAVISLVSSRWSRGSRGRPVAQDQARWRPGFSRSVAKLARVTTGAPGVVTNGTTR